MRDPLYSIAEGSGLAAGIGAIIGAVLFALLAWLMNGGTVK